MESLANLESFARSAEHGGFSAAARRLGLTPAAVSRNVAMLERNLGVRLFQRTTRSLALTEAGERFLSAIAGNLDGLQTAIANVANVTAPAGVLRVSVIVGFGREFIVPLLPAFRARYPDVQLELQLGNRRVDLVTEGLDAAIGGGFELAQGIVAKRLSPSHLIAVASPAYMRGRKKPRHPAELETLDGVLMRSVNTGRIIQRTMRTSAGIEAVPTLKQTVVLDDQDAMAEAAAHGLGVAIVAVPYAEAHLKRRALVRLLPDWCADLGSINLYYASRAHLAAKTRVFVDYLLDAAKRERWDVRFSGLSNR
jgi:DNA-binding transcriptional LysR family regulator